VPTGEKGGESLFTLPRHQSSLIGLSSAAAGTVVGNPGQCPASSTIGRSTSPPRSVDTRARARTHTWAAEPEPYRPLPVRRASHCLSVSLSLTWHQVQSIAQPFALACRNASSSDLGIALLEGKYHTGGTIHSERASVAPHPCYCKIRYHGIQH
jgi:hypothetical protein